MTRAALLTRVSDKTQASEDRHSLAYQRDLMLACAERKGWEVVNTFAIPGESAFRWYIAERPQFKTAIDAAARGDFDVLVVYDLSRFARNQSVLHETRRILRDAGVMLWSATGDYDAVQDGLRAGMEGIVAEQSSTDHSRKVRHAYERRHARGLPTGDVPFGYVRSSDTTQPPTVVPEEAAAIKAAFRAYAHGRGYLAIAGDLNRAGLRPRSKRGLEAFTVSSVQSLIETRFYVGVVTHRGHEAPGKHEAILTEEEWQAASASTRRHGTHRETSYKAILAGIPTCAHCVGPIWSNAAGAAKRHYYFEPGKERARECPAAGRRWSASAADALVESMVLGMRLEGEWADAAYRIARRGQKRADTASQRRGLEAQRQRAGEAYADGALSRDAYHSRLAKIDAQLKALPEDAAEILRAGDKLTQIADAWEVASGAERNELCRILYEGIRIDVLGRELWVKPRPEFEAYMSERRRWRGYADGTPDRTRSLVLPSAAWYAPAELVA